MSNTEQRSSGTILRANPKGGRPPKDGHYPMDWVKESETMVWRIGYCLCGRKICLDNYDMEGIVSSFAYVIKSEELKLTFKQKLAEWLYARADKLKGAKEYTQEERAAQEMHMQNMERQFRRGEG
jgi:hypothetical protein